MRHHSVPFNVVCTSEEKARLVAMAARAQCSQAEIVRRALDREFHRMVDAANVAAAAGAPNDMDKELLRRLLNFCGIR